MNNNLLALESDHFLDTVIAFKHPAAVELEISGGKGANLARLASSLPVPDGFIITSQAYRLFICTLFESIQSILQQTEDTEQQTRRIQELILKQPFAEGFRQQLDEYICKQGMDQWYVAVRSSATTEDLPGAAFAGQHDTFLNCKGVAEIETAIKKCYASLWHTHALMYRARLGLNHMDAAMAVVVQKMVHVGVVDAAGVAFSVDPIQGKLAQVLINSAFGLGESVVGGEQPVDEFRVDFAGQQIVEQTIACKNIALISNVSGERSGTLEITLSEEQGARASINHEQCLAIAALAKKAESFFGFPQDIEWAYDAGQLHLLQSRPVTYVPERWTRDESAERFPNAVTPLTWDLVEEGFHTSLNYSFNLMGLPHFGGKWFAMKDFYIYGNQNAVELYSGRIPIKIQSLEDVRNALPLLASKFTWIQDLPIIWMRDLDTYLLAIGALMQEEVEKYSLKEQWQYIQRIRDVGTAYFLPNIAISLTQGTLYKALYQLLVISVGEVQARTLYDELLAACPTKTVEVNNELWQLSRTIAHTPELMTLLQNNSAALCVSKLAHESACSEFSVFNQALSVFLKRHGHRELDFDAYYPTWVEAPHTVIDQLRALSELPDNTHQEREWSAILKASSARHRLLSFMPEDLRYLAEEVIQLARAYTQLDDLEHYQTTRLTLPFRKGLRAMGEVLVQKGVIATHSDLFFATFADIDQAIAQNDFSELAKIIETQKIAWEKARLSTPDWIYGQEEKQDFIQDGMLKGLSGSPGHVEGEVFLVYSPEEFSQFPQNAILVARTTNPAWTSLFYRAKGVITESGGPLSHGAVTARELGIPAVMSVRGVMTSLQNGTKVRINGQQGIVTLL